ncbi:MAG: tyrosine-type recombinase/integrase [Sphingomonadales bacterium]|nr:tyrosine-type recombinase/integrase [Sphingomonadales bacterium]MDE2171927.1 tyrosine-type recombinase/integrase [Sphingomonadales bacterium]
MAFIIRAAPNYSPIPPNFPLLHSNRLKIIEPAFRYLIEQMELRAHSAETIRTYGEHLYEWFDALEQSDLSWDQVNEGTILAYRNRMLEAVSPHTGRPYARSTINDRIGTVCRFYAWALRRQLIGELPFTFRDAPPVRSGNRGFLAHASGRPGPINNLIVAEYETLPRPLRVPDLHRLLAALGMPYRLIAEWAVTTGMRRMELCALTVPQIPHSEQLHPDENAMVGIQLTVTKGGKTRRIYPPLKLVDRTNWYIGEDRAALINRRSTKHPEYTPPQQMFLNRRGAPITKARLSAALADGFAAAGLDGSVHWLRHTFAMVMLVRLQAAAQHNPDINPLKVLQVLLGHASVETTAIYLRCVDLHESDVAEAIDYLYGQEIGDGH